MGHQDGSEETFSVLQAVVIGLLEYVHAKMTTKNQCLFGQVSISERNVLLFSIVFH